MPSFNSVKVIHQITEPYTKLLSVALFSSIIIKDEDTRTDWRHEIGKNRNFDLDNKLSSCCIVAIAEGEASSGRDKEDSVHASLFSDEQFPLKSFIPDDMMVNSKVLFLHETGFMMIKCKCKQLWIRAEDQRDENMCFYLK